MPQELLKYNLMSNKKRALAWDKCYLDIAKNISNMSYAKRRKVGAVLVKNSSIIGYGYNGMPAGMPNSCEISGTTRKEVLHAETNAITKIAKSNESTNGATLYVTLSPCFECSKLISQSGIKRVCYIEEYRNTEGLEYLKSLGIEVVQVVY